MTYLPSLIKKIDDFYGLAQTLLSLHKKAAGRYDEDEGEEEETSLEEGDDKSTYNRARSLIEEFSGDKTLNQTDLKDILEELELAAEIFRTAVDINGGYQQAIKKVNVAGATISEAIESLFGVSDDKKEEMTDKMYDVIEAMNTELRTLSKQNVLQQADEVTVADAFDAVETSFERQVGPRTEQEGGVEEPEQDEEEPEFGVSRKPSIKDLVDVGREPKEKGSFSIRSYHWAKTPQEYEDEAKNLAERYKTETNPKTRQNIEALSKILINLRFQLEKTIELRGAVKLMPNDEETKRNLMAAEEELARLRKERIAYKNRLSGFLLDGQVEDLEKRQVMTRDPNEKAWLQQKIELINLRKSRQYKKEDEIEARKALLRETGHQKGDPDTMGYTFIPIKVSPERMEQLQNNLQAAHEKVMDASEYDRIRSINKSIQQGRTGVVPVRQKGRRGGGTRGARIKDFNFEVATWPGRADRMKRKIDTATHVSRLGVTQVVKREGKKTVKSHNELKPFVEALSESIQNIIAARLKLAKDPNNISLQEEEAWAMHAKYEAIKNLKAQLVDWASKEPAIRELEKNVRLLPHYAILAAQVANIIKWHNEETGWNLSEDQKQYISTVISEFDRLLNLTKRFYAPDSANVYKKSVFGNMVKQLDINFTAAIGYISAVLNEIEFQTGVTAAQPEPPVQQRIEQPRARIEEPRARIEEPLEEEEQGQDPLKRMKLQTSRRMGLMARIVQEEKLFSLGQDVSVNTNVDQMTDQIFDQIYDEVIDGIFNKLRVA